MKFKTTGRKLEEGYFCFTAGYCELQYLLYYAEPIAYNCGIYGWNFDAYAFGNICITMGYRNMVGPHVPKEVSELDHQAEHILYSRDIDYDERKPKIEELVEKAINILREEVRNR